jgi:hypothetical protein
MVILYQEVLKVQPGAFGKDLPEFGERAGDKVSFRMIMAGQRMSAHYDPIDIISDMLEKRCSVSVFQALEDLPDVIW